MVHVMNRTANIDPFFEDMYNRSSSIYALYLGFDTSTSVFRRFPGHNTFQDKPEYDPSVRPWYTAAKAAPDRAVFTAPYLDAHGAGWMITAARAIYDRNIEEPTIIGVAGIDVLITDMKELVDSITFLDNGKVVLIDLPSEQVVTAKDWVLDDGSSISCIPVTGSDPDPFMYYDLKKPAIKNHWESIESLDVGATTTFKSEGTIIYATRLDLFEGQYVLLAFIPLSEIDEQIDDTLRQNARNSQASMMVVISVLVVVGFVSYLAVRSILNGVLKNFDAMERNVERLLQNVGKSDLDYGMVVLDEGASAEIANMQGSINELISNIRSDRKATVDDVQAGQQMMNTLADLVPLDALVVERDIPVASAPPLAAWGVPVVHAHAVSEDW